MREQVENNIKKQLADFIDKQAMANCIGMEQSTKRYYPYGSLASSVIGFTGADDHCLSGLEQNYNDLLTGTPGRLITAKDAKSNSISDDYSTSIAAQDGDSLILTINQTIQYYLEKGLRETMEQYRSKGTYGVVMDCNTGAVLAMASLPTYDLNSPGTVYNDFLTSGMTEEQVLENMRDLLNKQWRSKAINDTYEPGSTFKTLTLAMALEENVVDLNTGFYCSGSVKIEGETINCSKRAPGHGQQTLTQAFATSCTPAFINIGLRIGNDKFYQYMLDFGLTEKTGIDTTGEASGFVNSEIKYSTLALACYAFGQNFNVTPIALITAQAACVNGGYLMKPYVVKSIVNSDGEAVVSNSPTVVRQVVSEQTSATVRQILEQVVGDPVDCTGMNSYGAGYRSGGKTGTSEKVAQDAAGGAKEYIVSFIGFAPADDPQIVILVLLDTPSNSTGIYISGGLMAAPDVGKMMADILPYLGVEPSYSETEKTHMDKTVPNVTGLSVEQAKAALAEVGLQARIYGDGSTITAQLPGSGAVVANGSTILLYAGKEPSADKETMPDLSNLSYQTARDRMAALGLYIKTSSSITDTAAQVISGQSVAAGTQIDHGTVVEVTLVTSDSGMLGRY